MYDVVSRNKTLLQVNNRLARILSERDAMRTAMTRVVATATGGNVEAGSRDERALDALLVAAAAVADVRNVLLRTLIVEFYHPFLECTTTFSPLPL